MNASRRLGWNRSLVLAALVASVLAADARGGPMYAVRDLGTVYRYTQLNDRGEMVGERRDSQLTDRTAVNAADGSINYSNDFVLLNNVGQQLRGRFSDPNNASSYTFSIRRPDGVEEPILGLRQQEYAEGFNDRGQVLFRNNEGRSASIITDGVRVQFFPSSSPTERISSITAFGNDGSFAGYISDPKVISGQRRKTFITEKSGELRRVHSDEDESNPIVAINSQGQFLEKEVGLKAFNSGPNLYQANAFNESGVIVGGTTLPGAVLFDPAQADSGLVFLNDSIDPSLGVFLQDALRINKMGQILADGYIRVAETQRLEGHSYLLTPLPSPVPEPGTWMIAAVLVAGAYFRRRAGSK